MIDSQTLLSRVADSLYWMSRYLERAENTSRLADVYMNSMLDMAPGMVEQQYLERLQQSLAIKEKFIFDNSDASLQYLTFDSDLPTSIMVSVRDARENARQTREQISSEMWTQLNRLYLHVNRSDAVESWRGAPHNFYIEVKEGSHLFQGITDATMNHNQGWHFIQIGRYLERSLNLLQLIQTHFENKVLTVQHELRTDWYFEMTSTLKSVSAFEAYCKVYSPNMQTVWILEFLLFNNEFPRSLRFCIEKITTSLHILADATNRSKKSRLYRQIGRLQSQLSYDDIDDIHQLSDYIEDIKQQIYQIHAMLYDTFITYPIETAIF